MDAHKIDTEEVINRVYELHAALIHRDTYEHDVFDPTRYKWIIGHKAYAAIEAAIPVRIREHEAPKLFSIPVDINLTKTETIELWENITEKL